jgi:hypothetical protein
MVCGDKTFKEVIKMRPLEYALTNCEWYLYKKRIFIHTKDILERPAEREDHVTLVGNLQGKDRGLGRK